MSSALRSALRLLSGSSPLAFASIAAALLVYLPVHDAALHRCCLSCALPLAAFSATLSAAADPDLRRLAYRLAFFAVGLIVGLMVGVNEGQSSASLGLPASRVVAYEVELTDDAVRTRRGGLLYRGRLLAVVGHQGSVASARGTIVITGGRTPYAWGRRLRLSGIPGPGGRLGSDWQGRVTGPLRVLPGERRYFDLRRRIRDGVERRVVALGGREAGLFMALFLGGRESLDSAESYFFRRAGAIHLLALSGFHLGILSFILVALLAPLLGKPRAVVVAALCLGAYLFVAGPKVSLLRALLMFATLGLCRLAGVKARGFDLLSLAFLFCLFVWPASLRSLSFELSYLALGGILVLAPRVAARLEPFLPRLVCQPAAAAVAAQIATAPFLALSFGVLYPVGLFAGLALTPLVTAFLWGGLAFLALPLPALVQGLLVDLLSILHGLIRGTAELFARCPPLAVGRPVVALGAALFALALLELPDQLAHLRRSQRTRTRATARDRRVDGDNTRP